MALSTIFSVLVRKDVLTVLVVLATLPFLFLYFSTSAFFRRARSKSKGKTPPVVPFYFPLVFHTFSLMTAGPQKYFAQLLKDYGNFAPFMVMIASKPFVILRNPDHISKVLEASDDFAHERTEIDVLEKLFGLPQSATKFYAAQHVSSQTGSSPGAETLSLADNALQGEALTEIAETYIGRLFESMNDKMIQVGTWTLVEDSWSFFQQVVSRCTIETLCGTDLFKQYPGVLKDFSKFSEAIEDFLPGMPNFMVTSVATTEQEKLHQGLEKWLKTNHGGPDFARTGDSDPAWDAIKGSKFVQLRDDQISKIDGVDLKCRTADLLSVIHGSLSTLVPLIVWTLFEVLRRPQVFKTLTQRVSQYRPSQGASYNISAVSQTPILQSIHAEVMRLRVSKAITRLATSKPFDLDDHWTIPANTSLLAFSSDAGTNAPSWEKARPEAVIEPLGQFWAERFFVSNKTAKKLQQIDQQPIPDERGGKVCSTAGLEGLFFGGSEHPQRHLGPGFLRQILAATLAIMLGDFELQLCDTEAFDAAVPPAGDVAYGTIKPLEPVAMRIRQRIPV